MAKIREFVQTNDIVSDDAAIASINTKVRSTYARCWLRFRTYAQPTHNWDLEAAIPSEKVFLDYFKLMRERGWLSSSLTTAYSQINSVIKYKYTNKKLQMYLRLTKLLRSYDTGKPHDFLKLCNKSKMPSSR